MLKVVVEDTGIGIKREELPKLFKKFGKLHRTAEFNDQGIGLGLLIAKEVVESGGGSIFAVSEGQGKGSKCIFNMKMDEAIVS